jgi:hypothetical protein
LFLNVWKTNFVLFVYFFHRNKKTTNLKHPLLWLFLFRTYMNVVKFYIAFFVVEIKTDQELTVKKIYLYFYSFIDLMSDIWTKKILVLWSRWSEKSLLIKYLEEICSSSKIINDEFLHTTTTIKYKRNQIVELHELDATLGCLWKTFYEYTFW